MGVTLGVVHDQHMEAGFVKSLLTLNRDRQDLIDGTLFIEGSVGSFDHARNKLSLAFLEKRSEWLLFLDTDMVFRPSDLDALLLAAKEKRTRMVSGLYFVDTKPPLPCAFRFDKAGRSKYIEKWGDGEVFRVDHVGAGFCLVHRKVFEDISESRDWRDRPFFSNAQEGPAGQILEPDFAFFYRAGLKHHKLYVVSDAFIGHIKPRVLGYE